MKLFKKRILTNGSSRTVILTKKYAVKIPKIFTCNDNKFYGLVISFLNGWIANRYEYKWSKSNIYDFLCPVQYSFLFSIIIVMYRAEPISEEMFLGIKKKNFGYEHKQDSYGLLNNTIVIVDYGN